MGPTSDIYLEVGTRRVFAGALAWPGCCRSARTDEAALETLLEYGSRYAAVMSGARITFTPPRDTASFDVVERLEGDATTDFGAPGRTPVVDENPVHTAYLNRLTRIL